MGRSPCCEKGHTTKGAWTKEEDQKLIQYIKAHGDGCWKSLPSAAGLSRCGKSCRLRWINYLRPDLKRGNFTAAEEQLIIQLHEKLGNKWSVIAMNLPGRTDNEIKNYWNTHIKRKLLSQGIDPQTHRQIAPADAQSVDPHMRNQISAAAQAVDPQTRNQISAAAASFSPSRYRPVQYDRAHGRSKILVDATSTSEPDSAAVSFMQSRLKRGRDALSGSSSSGGDGDGDGGFVDYQGGVCLCFQLRLHSCEACTGQCVPRRFIQPKLEEREQRQSD